MLTEGRVSVGRLAIDSMDIETDLARRPGAHQFRQSLPEYFASSAFQSQQTRPPRMMKSLFYPP